MDTPAQQIAEQVAEHTKYWIACIGILGGVTGSLLTILGNLAIQRYKEYLETRKDRAAKDLLVEMLEDASYPKRWRNFDTLRHVVGADEATAKRLLLQVGARASEDGEPLWGLKKYHPLEKHKND